jgi:phospholipid/cholesterol/gamma-HCH transport system permease protein
MSDEAKTPGFLANADRLFQNVGEASQLFVNALRSVTKRPYEWRAIVEQIDSLGVASMGIVLVTSVFIGMVMTMQFAFGLQRFGGLEYIPRVVSLSFARELAPSLTSVIVGGRIGSGMAAEVGAMNVTEQVDAIRALGADPAKKLVMPRLVASIIVMPLLSIFAFVLGISGAIIVSATQFDVAPPNFVRSAFESVSMVDFMSGFLKTPIFGAIIAIVGCHFGLTTRGGTAGVGQSTTRTVVVVSISILIADLFLTKLFVLLLGTE